MAAIIIPGVLDPDPPPPSRARRTSLLWTAAVLGALVAVPFLLRLPLIERRGFDPDEFEHLHFAWRISRGDVPYRDYFDHHTPWLHFLLSRFFARYHVETSSADAVAFVFLARRLVWPFAAAILGCTFGLARKWAGRREAWASMLLLANTRIFLSKTLEVRPDVPATAFVVASLLFALAGWQRLADARKGPRWLFLASGAACGVATMFTQKVLFVAPGLALAAVWLVSTPHLAAPRSERLRCVAAQVAGFLLPVALTLAYFWRQGALRAFLDFNFVVNARWPGLGPRDFVLQFLREDPAFVTLAAVGFAARARALGRREGVARGEPLLALALWAPIAGLLVHPAVTFHYFLLFLPQASLYAGSALVWVADALAAAWQLRRMRPVPGDVVLAGLAALLSIHPLLRLVAAYGRGNFSTLEGIRYVIRNSAPWETTLDGFSGLGVFRPQAFFHQYQHWHFVAVQSEAERRQMLEALQTGAAMPKLIFWDQQLRDGVPPAVLTFLDAHYVPTRLPPIRARLFDNGLGWWSDEGPRYLGWVQGHERSPHVLCESGWRDPGLEDGVPCRRSRTPSSDLAVPIREPRDFRAVVRAKAYPQSLPLNLDLMINGTAVGRVPVEAGWRDYEFPVREGQLRPGLNDFKLRYKAPDGGGDRRLELAVELLDLRRAP